VIMCCCNDGRRSMFLRTGSLRRPKLVGLRRSLPSQRTESVTAPIPPSIPQSAPLRGGRVEGLARKTKSVGHGQRRVFDLPPPSHVEVAEHQADPFQCAGCRHLRQAVFPDVVRAPTQYGHRGVPAGPALTALEPLGEAVREPARSPDLQGHAGRRDAPSGGTLEGLHPAAAGSAVASRDFTHPRQCRTL